MNMRRAALLSALLLVASCSSAISGSAAPAVTAGVTAALTGDSSLGPITEPTAPPTAGSSSAPGPTSQDSSGTAPTTAAPTPATPTTATPTTAATAGAVPAGLAKFYGQKLSWGSCASYATTTDEAPRYTSPQLQCAYLTVPMVYANPGGATIKIGVLRTVAGNSATRIGSLLFNPGGPGASGMSIVADLAVLGYGQALRTRFDLVGFDPRGIGSSVPLITCQTDAELDASRAATVRSNTPAAVAAANARLTAYAAGCVTATSDGGKVDGKTFLANVGTRDVAADMDVLRAVLGDARLSYAGFSYGTRLGYVYAERFPQNVRAMVLDGAVDPDEDAATEATDQAKGFQQAFVAFATSCALRATCPLGTDPAKATTVFQSSSRPLLARPLPVAGGRVLSYADATLGVAEALYDNRDWPTLTSALAQLRTGDGTGLLALADQYYGRLPSGRYGLRPDSFNAIRCVDDAWPTDPAEVTKSNAAQAAAAPFESSGDPAADIPDQCGSWPVPPTLSPHRLVVPGLPQVLVVSTTGDPATPYASGVDLAKQLGARLLTFEGTRHTAYLTARNQCVDDAGNAYLLNLTLPVDGARCS